MQAACIGSSVAEYYMSHYHQFDGNVMKDIICSCVNIDQHYVQISIHRSQHIWSILLEPTLDTCQNRIAAVVSV